MSVFVFMYVHHVCAMPAEQKRPSDPLQVGLQISVNSHVVLETEFGSPVQEL